MVRCNLSPALWQNDRGLLRATATYTHTLRTGAALVTVVKELRMLQLCRGLVVPRKATKAPREKFHMGDTGKKANKPKQNRKKKKKKMAVSIRAH